eukprot:2245714-Prymnesium_polylepis.1
MSSHRTFSGFRSRCMKPFECKCERPCSMSAVMRATVASAKGALLEPDDVGMLPCRFEGSQLAHLHGGLPRCNALFYLLDGQPTPIACVFRLVHDRKGALAARSDHAVLIHRAPAAATNRQATAQFW